MKPHHVFGLIGCLLATLCMPTLAQTWIPQSSGTTNWLMSVSFVDSINGWVVGGWLGNNCTILHTTNGGNNWVAQNSPVTSELRGVDFVDLNNGWAVGHNGTILHTANGGSNWVLQNSGTTVEFYGVAFVDDNQGWAVGDHGNIRHTTNGGADWTAQNSGTTSDLRGVTFVDSNTGWVVGADGTILRTTNGGTNWIAQNSGTTDVLFSVNFVNASQGWAVGGVYQSVGTILHTTNGGNTWITQYRSAPNYIFGVAFVDSSQGWAVGASILNTDNSGGTWHVQYTYSSYYLSSVTFVDANTGWAVGSEGMILHYTNSPPQPQIWFHQNSGTTAEFFGVDFIDENYGWVVGEHGAIRHTTDGGSDWTAQNSGTTSTLYSVSFCDEDIGWIVGGGGVIRHTTNGGADWVVQNSGTSDDLRCVTFVNANQGWVVGGVYQSFATILHTTNGGNTWITQYRAAPNFLFGVSFVDTSEGWAVGASILNTINGGDTWHVQHTYSSYYLVGVDFIDANTGWAVGSNCTILRTTNGGGNWISQHSGSIWLSGVSFVDANIGWAVGGWYSGSGTILHTINGGDDWFTQNSPVSSELRGVDFVNANAGWAVGYNGTILRYNSSPDTCILEYTQVDMGDLSACNYPTIVMNPAHALTGVAWLGANVTGEVAPHILNLDGADDGVVFHNLPWMPGQLQTVTVTITSGPNYQYYLQVCNGQLFLNGWKDGNLDGDFCDTLYASPGAAGADEWIVQDLPVQPGVYNLEFIDPGVLNMGVYDGIFRWRLTSEPVGRFGFGLVDNSTCPYMNHGSYAFDLVGEVEDYILPRGQLPVEMTSFNAVSGDAQVTLRWTTASETNNDHFVLYRRVQGNNDFTAMVQVPGNGTTTTEHTYEYVDNVVINGVTYEYQISDVDINGGENIHDQIVSVTPMSSLTIPTEYALYQNYPNPFNSSTTIRFDIKEASHVSLKVFDLLGREVTTLVNNYFSEGTYTVSWEASGVASGIYFYSIKSGDFIATKKLLLLK